MAGKKALQPAEEIPVAVFPLSPGKRTYELMTDNPQNFQIIKVEVDPLDVEEGENQQVIIWVEDSQNNPITAENRVEGTVFTDNKATSFNFQLREVFDDNNATIALWQGSWILNDTYNRIYVMNIIAKSVNHKDEIDLTFR